MVLVTETSNLDGKFCYIYTIIGSIFDTFALFQSVLVFENKTAYITSNNQNTGTVQQIIKNNYFIFPLLKEQHSNLKSNPKGTYIYVS